MSDTRSKTTRPVRSGTYIRALDRTDSSHSSGPLDLALLSASLSTTSPVYKLQHGMNLGPVVTRGPDKSASHKKRKGRKGISDGLASLLDPPSPFGSLKEPMMRRKCSQDLPSPEHACAMLPSVGDRAQTSTRHDPGEKSPDAALGGCVLPTTPDRRQAQLPPRGKATSVFQHVDQHWARPSRLVARSGGWSARCTEGFRDKLQDLSFLVSRSPGISTSSPRTGLARVGSRWCASWEVRCTTFSPGCRLVTRLGWVKGSAIGTGLLSMWFCFGTLLRWVGPLGSTLLLFRQL